MASGYVEYVDTEEEETTMIAMNIKDLAAARSNPQVRSLLNLPISFLAEPTHFLVCAVILTACTDLHRSHLLEPH